MSEHSIRSRLPVADAASDAGLRAELAALRAEVEALQRRLALHEEIERLREASPLPAAASLPIAALPSLPRRCEVDAAQALPVEDGFHGLEWGPRGAYRWTGPGQETRFRLWIDRAAPLRLLLDLFHQGEPGNRHRLSVVVEGTRYPLLEMPGEGRLATWGIPPRAGAGPTDILLHVPHVHAPAAKDGAGDTRMLGVAVLRLVAEPA
jgi:hypothetical protein